MSNPTCKNCQRSLTSPAEPEVGQWIVRCFECGVKNIIAKLHFALGKLFFKPLARRFGSSEPSQFLLRLLLTFLPEFENLFLREHVNSSRRGVALFSVKIRE